MEGSIRVDGEDNVVKARFFETGDGSKYAKVVVHRDLVEADGELGPVLDELQSEVERERRTIEATADE